MDHTPSALSALPDELIDAFLQHVDDQADTHRRRDLASCSLVCWRWLPIARLYLFRRILVSPAFARSKPLQDLFDLLEASPHIALCISHLTIFGFHKFDQITVEHIFTFLSLLPRLERLSLHNAILAGNPTTLLHETFSLKTLELTGIHCLGEHTYESLAHLLCVFSAIGSLKLSSVLCSLYNEDARPMAQTGIAHPNINMLSIENCDLDLWLFWQRWQNHHLTSGSDTAMLRGIDLRFLPSSRNARDIVATLSQLSPSLRTIELRIYAHPPSDQTMLQSFDEAIRAISCTISQCSQLHSFALSCEPLPNLDVVAYVLKHIPATVCHVSLRIPWDKATVSLWMGIIDICRHLAQLGLKSIAIHDTSRRQMSQAAARQASYPRVALDELQQLMPSNIFFVNEEPSCSRLGCAGFLEPKGPSILSQYRQC